MSEADRKRSNNIPGMALLLQYRFDVVPRLVASFFATGRLFLSSLSAPVDDDDDAISASSRVE